MIALNQRARRQAATGFAGYLRRGLERRLRSNLDMSAAGRIGTSIEPCKIEEDNGEPRIISRFDSYWPRLWGDERDRVGGGAAIGPFLRSPRCGGGLLRNSTQTPLIYSTQPGAAARSSQTKRRML
jgi:hypothetical protein